MAVPASGPLKLWDDLWNQELGGSQGNNSLHSASVYAGFTTPDALSDFYGWSDVEVPGVQTNAMTSVSYYAMTANGTVNSTGNENPDRGFYFGTNSSAATNNVKYSVGTGGTGAFSRNMDSQVNQYNVTYYAWAYACNSAGEAVGSRVSATTPYPPFSPTTKVHAFSCYSISNYGQSNIGYINPYSGQLAYIWSTNSDASYSSAPWAINARAHIRAQNTEGVASSATQWTLGCYYNNCWYTSFQAAQGPSPATSIYQGITEWCMRGAIFYPDAAYAYIQWRYCAKEGPIQ